jgi:hypothetical protein
MGTLVVCVKRFEQLCIDYPKWTVQQPFQLLHQDKIFKKNETVPFGWGTEEIGTLFSPSRPPTSHFDVPLPTRGLPWPVPTSHPHPKPGSRARNEMRGFFELERGQGSDFKPGRSTWT